jgi:hypothetical protein
MAYDLCGDALSDLAFGLWIYRQREIGMRLDVDEAGRDHEPLGIHRFARRGADRGAYRYDAMILDPHVTGDARVAGAVK